MPPFCAKKDRLLQGRIAIAIENPRPEIRYSGKRSGHETRIPRKGEVLFEFPNSLRDWLIFLCAPLPLRETSGYEHRRNTP